MSTTWSILAVLKNKWTLSDAKICIGRLNDWDVVALKPSHLSICCSAYNGGSAGGVIMPVPPVEHEVLTAAAMSAKTSARPRAMFAPPLRTMSFDDVLTARGPSIRPSNSVTLLIIGFLSVTIALSAPCVPSIGYC